jgi:iron complex outermembrane receptor protein
MRPVPAALAFALCALSPVAASAQTVSGSVSGAGAALVAATIRLLELDRVQQTGANGQFAFAHVPAGQYRLLVTSAGYAPATDTITVTSGNLTVRIDLRPSAVTLDAVVVTASPLARTTSDIYQPASTKSRVDLLNSAGTSFAEKIGDLPGVAVRGFGSAPSRPILRGLSQNEVLVLENGLRMGDISTYDPAHATPIDALAISQVDVVRGPATVLYGPSTIGGVVNLITNVVPAVSEHAVSGTAALETNSVSNESAGYLSSVYSTNRQAFVVSGGWTRAGDIRIPAGAYTDPGTGAVFNLNRLPQTFERSGEVGAGYAYQGTAGSIGFGARHFDMNYGIPGVPPNADFLDVPPTTSRIAQQRNLLEIRGAVNAGGAVVRQLRMTASYNDYTHSEFPTTQDSSGISDPEANHFHKRELNAVLQVQHQPLGKFEGTLGLWTNVEHLDISGDAPLGPNSVTTGLAGYAFEEYVASPGTRLQAGLRYDYNRIQTTPFAGSPDSVFQTLDESRLSNAVTASLGVVRRLSSGLTGSFSIARSFRAPTVQELFANGLDAASGTYSVGTASLGPETGLGIDAAIKGSYDHATFEVTPFVNYIHDYMYGFLRGDTIQNFPVRQFAATNARLTGMEASLVVEPVQHVAIRASTDYVNAQDTRLHVPLPFTPPLRGLLRTTYQDDRYLGMAEVRLAASQTRLAEGETPTSGYAVLNLGAGLRFLHHGVVSNLGVHVDNVLNRVYRDHLSVIKDFIPQPARGFRVNYEVVY